jgi:thiol-disulfide isomerase/thioredoxin
MRILIRLAPVVALAGLVFGCLRSEQSAGEVGLVVGKLAPEVTGHDLEGQPVKLSELHGKVVLLDFFQTPCPPCKVMHTYERALVEQYKGRPFEILGVNCDPHLSTVRHSSEKEGITWRTVWDGKGGSNFMLWGVDKTPTIFLLDQQGVIRYKSFGPPSSLQVLEKQINQLLQETS